MNLLANLIPASAEIFLLVMVCFILIADLMLTKSSKFFTYLLVLLTLIGCMLITVGTHQSTTVYAFNNMFVSDQMSGVLKLMSYLGMFMVMVYSRQYLMERGMFTGEFMSLALFALLGMNVMISANHFLTLYLGLELLSLSLYAMVALQRDSAVATEAAMKYFVLGALASGLLLYGMSMLYGATGSLELGAISDAINTGVQNKPLLAFGLVFIVSGLAFKLGVVPFHMWVPDVYHGAPTAMTMLIGSVPKLAAFAFAIRILVEGLQGLVQDWTGMLIIMAIASMALGNLAAIAQTNIKRMFAYSTITHMGFLLLGFINGGVEGYGASMFYALIYVMMSLGAFGMIMILSRAGFEADEISDFKGLNQRSPWLAFMMMLLMVSMAGIPPTVGFYAKLAVLNSIIQTGHIWLAVVAVLFSLIGAFYYLRVIKVMYFDAPETHAPIVMGFDTNFLISINGLGVLILGLMPGTLLLICSASVQQSLLLH